MRALMIVVCVMGIALSLCTGVCLAAEEADLIEFAKVEDAKKFGWGALPGAVLTTAPEKKIGTSALRSDPGLKPKLYMGMGLTHDIDLTGAGAEDKIIFFVKQNFGSDLCVNMTTEKGGVYRYVKVTHGQWSRVEVDLNLANWSQAENHPVNAWTKITYLHIYSKGFDKAGEYMMLDGFSVFVDGKPVVVRSVPKPE